MRVCPKCGNDERGIFMGTKEVNPDDNQASCPVCGWRGKVGELKGNEKAPRTLADIVADIMPYLSEEGQVYLSEHNEAWKGGSSPLSVHIEGDDGDGDDIEKMSKKKLIEALTTIGAEFDPKAKQSELVAVYKAKLSTSVTPPEQETDPEKMTMEALYAYLLAFEVEFDVKATREDLIKLYIAEQAKHVPPTA